MALENCPACKKAISVNARSCPNCGEPLVSDWAERKATKRGRRLVKIILWLFALVLFGPMVLAGIVEGITAILNEEPPQQVAGQMDVPQREPTPAERQAKAEQVARERAEAERRRVEEAAQKEQQERQAFMERLRREMNSFETFDISKFTGTNFGFLAVNTVFQVWASMVEEARGLTLSQEDRALVERFRAGAIKTQTWALPEIRDAYGPHIRKLLWDKDVTAKTFGDGYRTVEFVGGLFAANRNIKAFNDELWVTFRILRFQQARYKWFKEAREYTYFDIEGPDDNDLVVWGDGTFRVIK